MTVQCVRVSKPHPYFIPDGRHHYIITHLKHSTVRLITVAIHTYDRAVALKTLLENEGIPVLLQNVNLETPAVSSGVRVRIHEHDLPLALRIIENTEVFCSSEASQQEESHSIIVPTDFSDRSFNAVCVAFHLAAEHGANIRLLNSYIDPYVAGNMQLSDSLTYEIADTEARKLIAENARKSMQSFAARLKDMIKYGKLPPVKFSTKVVEGVPEDAIVEYGKINPPYLVVMGTRDSSRKQAELIGSVTAEVMDKCAFSVLTIPESSQISKDTKIHNIVVFTNLEQQDLLAIDTMARVFSGTQADVTIVHAPQRRRPFERSNRESMENIVAYCRKHFPSFTFHASSVLPDFDKGAVSEKNAPVDLIVIPNKKKNAFSRLFNPGLAHKILVEADIPLLVIPV